MLLGLGTIRDMPRKAVPNTLLATPDTERKPVAKLLETCGGVVGHPREAGLDMCWKQIGNPTESSRIDDTMPSGSRLGADLKNWTTGGHMLGTQGVLRQTDRVPVIKILNQYLHQNTQDEYRAHRDVASHVLALMIE